MVKSMPKPKIKLPSIMIQVVNNYAGYVFSIIDHISQLYVTPEVNKKYNNEADMVQGIPVTK